MANQEPETPSEKSIATINFGESLDITSVMEWREKLLTFLAEKSKVIFETANIEKIDTAGLQLLVAFVKDAKVQGLTISWSNPSDVLCRAAALTDLAESLELSAKAA